ncbi:MAG TPA: hypothetical protein VIE90_17095 [Candidatus Binatia bacterium]|jgi:hypothetical protein
MKFGRVQNAGEERTCPHCKATILSSATSCPICRHMLRAGAVSFEPPPKPTSCPLLVEGSLEHPGTGEALEYQVLMEVRDGTGKLLSRQMMGVGALHAAEKRIFSLRVEMSPAMPATDVKNNGSVSISQRPPRLSAS